MSAIRGIESAQGKLATESLSEIDKPLVVGAPETSVNPGVNQSGATQEVSFANVLGGVLDSTSGRLDAANQKADAFSRGVLDDVHGTMVAAKEAEISLKLVGSIRNKLLDAFQELWRTNV